MSSHNYDIAVIGGGIVGTAAAMALTERSRATLVVLEAEDHLAAHQTGHNSGVIHSGLYYKPGSLKARNCAKGREALYRFCSDYGVAHERCGKIVVAARENELPALDEIERRGRANGLQGLRRLASEEIREFEPCARGVAGLLVPDTGIVDFIAVTEEFADRVRERGGTVLTGAGVRAVRRTAGGLILETAHATHAQLQCRYLINCGGLQSDRIARMCGTDPGVRIVPFRGEYYELVPERRHLVRNLIYPVPDPAFPFLGVHFTQMIHGGVEAGPNAVLAWKREGYGRMSFSPRDAWAAVSYGGFWKLAQRYWRTGLDEYYRSFSRRAFVRGLQKLVPEIETADVRPAGTGVRAQALTPDGKLADDFRIIEAERMIHVCNAPSPAATASISIGETIAQLALKRFELPGPN